MARREAPVSQLDLVLPYPKGTPTSTRLTLQDLAMGRPTVLHLYTGWGGCWPCAEQMDQWASGSTYGQRVAFVCVGCAGSDLSRAFAMRLKLQKCTNTVAVQGDGPRWGQLGCNGFIVLDSKLNVVCSATSPFNQVRQLGFKHVECLLDALLAGAPPPKVCPGQFVSLHGLKAAELNGQSGVCLAQAGEDGRCVVALRSRREVKVKMENLTVSGEPDDDSDSDGNSDGDSDVSGARGDGDACEDSTWHTAKRACPTPRAEDGDADVRPLAEIGSVKVQLLDEQHEKCADALRELGRSRSRGALERVIESYTEHFATEESLLDEHLYGQSGSGSAGFDAAAGQRKSHFADHGRLLRDARALAKLGAPEGPIPAAAINKVLREFERHTADYDDTYAEPLSKALAACSA